MKQIKNRFQTVAKFVKQTISSSTAILTDENEHRPMRAVYREFHNES